MADVKPGIDYEKLKGLGVPDEVIATLDPADGGNVTPGGEVLFLDEERMKRREGTRVPYKNHPNGLGIKNFIATKLLATTPLTWEQTLRNFMLIVAGANLTGKDTLAAKAYKTVMNFEPDNSTHTHGNVMPLDVSVADEAKTRQSHRLPVLQHGRRDCREERLGATGDQGRSEGPCVRGA